MHIELTEVSESTIQGEDVAAEVPLEDMVPVDVKWAL